MRGRINVVALGLALVFSSIIPSTTHGQSLTSALLRPSRVPATAVRDGALETASRPAAVGPVRQQPGRESPGVHAVADGFVTAADWNTAAPLLQASSDDTRASAIKWAWRGLGIMGVGLAMMLLAGDADAVAAVGAGVLVLGVAIGSIAATVAATH